MRPLARPDFPPVLDLLQDVIEPQSTQKLDWYLEEASADNRFAVALVAEIAGAVVGVAAGAEISLGLPGLQVSEEEIARRICLLDVLAIHPEHRRRGLGGLLVRTLLDQFREAGSRVVMTKLAAGRHDLVPVYTRWGWSVGLPGAGLPVAVGPDPLVIGEDPAVRTAWKPLVSGVRLSPFEDLPVQVVIGIFA